jgi:hypothetical protein
MNKIHLQLMNNYEIGIKKLIKKRCYLKLEIKKLNNIINLLENKKKEIK